MGAIRRLNAEPGAGPLPRFKILIGLPGVESGIRLNPRQALHRIDLGPEHEEEKTRS